MKNKIIGLGLCLLLIATALPVTGRISNPGTEPRENTLDVTWNEAVPALITADWVQEQKLFASDGTFLDSFGYSVSIDGNTALIGAYNDYANGGFAGSAYVFTRSGTTWTQQAKLFPTSGGYYDFFGYSVSLNGNTALIGAPGSAFNPPYPGAAYIFTRTGTTWTQQAILTPADGQDGDYFGNAVALNQDTAIIQSEYWSSTGSVYVFTRSGTSWTQQTKIIPADGFNGEWFGWSLSINGDTAFIGAPGDDDNGGSSGSVYIYTRSGTTWTMQTKLLASDGATLDCFGQSVSISDDTLLIGAEWDGDNGYRSGSAYIFIQTGTSWTQQAKLLPDDGMTEDLFGHTVSISDDIAIIGANGDDEPGYNSGSAYIFTRTGTTWTQEHKLLPADPSEQKCFSESVSLDGTTALIGAYGDNQGTGSAYIFTRESQPPNPPTITGPGQGKPGTEYGYTFITTDPENEQVYYFIDWGDGTNSSWVGPYNSGVEMTKLHTWAEKGDYTIKAKAKDTNSMESTWGTLTITMPYSFTLPPCSFWENLFLQFSHAFPFLRHLLGY